MSKTIVINWIWDMQYCRYRCDSIKRVKVMKRFWCFWYLYSFFAKVFIKILFHKWILTGFPIIATVFNILQIFLCKNIYAIGQPPVLNIFSEVSIVHAQLPYLLNIYIMCTTIKLCDRLCIIVIQLSYSSILSIISLPLWCHGLISN